MNTQRARLDLVWHRTVEAMATLDEAHEASWQDNPELWAEAQQAFEAILTLSGPYCDTESDPADWAYDSSFSVWKADAVRA